MPEKIPPEQANEAHVTGDPESFPRAHPGAPRDPKTIGEILEGLVIEPDQEAAHPALAAKALSIDEARRIIQTNVDGGEVDPVLLAEARKVVRGLGPKE